MSERLVQLVRHAARVVRSVEEGLSTVYFNSNPLVLPASRRFPWFRPRAGVPALILLTVFARLFCLLVSRTGQAKTTILWHLASWLLGRAAPLVTLSTKTDLDSFVGVSYKALQEGGTLEECYEPREIITSPLAVVDELTRQHAQLQHESMAVVSKQAVIDARGRKFANGLTFEAYGRTVHWKWIASAMNEHDGSALEQIDKALLSRFDVIVPLDAFLPAPSHVRQMLHGVRSMTLLPRQEAGCMEDLKGVVALVDEVPLSAAAGEWIAYMAGVNHCIKGPGGLKPQRFALTACTGCRVSAMGKANPCGNILYLAPRTLLSLAMASRGMAVLRSAKLALALKMGAEGRPALGEDEACQEAARELRAGLADATAVAPFVLIKKLLLREDYAQRAELPDDWTAIRSLVEFTSASFLEWQKFLREKDAKGRLVPDELLTYLTSKDPRPLRLDEIQGTDEELRRILTASISAPNEDEGEVG